MAAAFWGLGIYLEPIDGDLTRVGYLSERSFGWNRQQPDISAGFLKNHAISEADILAIGDSFSETLVWQTQFASSGLKIHTITNTAVDSAFSYDFLRDKTLCGNTGAVADSLRKAGFKGKYIIIESVERSFQLRMKNSCGENNAAEKLSYRNKFDSQPPPPPYRSRAFSIKSSFNYSLGWLLKVLKNEIRLRRGKPPEGLLAFDDVRVAALNDGCALFSNRLCNYGLFIAADFAKKTFDSTDKILLIDRNLRQSGLQVIWVVVPDKSTIYLGYGRYNQHPYVNIWNELARYPELTAPNLGELFTRQAKTTKDFYAPDNTHLSTNGYLYFGDLLLNRIKYLESR